MMDREKILAELDASDNRLIRQRDNAVTREFATRNQQLREALARIEELEAVVVPLERLRADEGNSVEIFCPNPDFGRAAHAIEVCGEWTNWNPRRFEGDTLAEALAAAVKAMEES